MADITTSPQLKKLQQHYQTVKDRFHQTHSKASKWLQHRSLDVDQFRTTSQQLLAAASLAGSIALNKPVDAQLAQHINALEGKKQETALSEVTTEEYETIMNKLQEAIKQPPGHLPEEEELYVEQQLSDLLGFEVTAELEGHQLNQSIGIMGGEQHLKRFPGDTLDQHDEYLGSGIAPNRGAFGWFTEDGILTEKAIEREKYYFAVQTLYLPDWNTNHDELKPWYKFRKMIVINPAEQMAVVGVVGDAGPALWVGKQYGGSPEIIRDAKIWSKDSRGRVMLLFVNDPEDKIPLGIIDLRQQFDLIQEATQ